MNSSYCTNHIPFAPYELSCNDAEIHRIEKRIEEIKSIKAACDTSAEVEDCDGLKIVEDTSLMRIQFVFTESLTRRFVAFSRPMASAGRRLSGHGSVSSMQMASMLRGA